MNRDTRTPVSVTIIGPYRVLVYDEEAYRQNIAEYYADEQSTPKPHVTRKRYPLPQKRKSRYAWAGNVLATYRGRNEREYEHAG